MVLFEGLFVMILLGHWSTELDTSFVGGNLTNLVSQV